MGGSRFVLFLVIAAMAGFAFLLVKWTNNELTSLRAGAALTSTVEAESSVLSGSASLVDDSNASGGKVIQFSVNSNPTPPITGVTYHIDCAGGNDSNNGTSPSSAWSSLSKGTSAPLNPGDALLLKRGCTWNGPLTISRSGTTTAYITIGAYGTGVSLPTITRSTNGADISVSGSFISFQNLLLTASPVNTVPTSDSVCPGAPIGNTQGISFESGSHDNIVQDMIITKHYAGVFIRSGSHHNHILKNTFQDNTMMSPLDTASNNDAGAFGVLLWGDDNEIASNTISGSDACSYDYVRDGSAIEVYGGQRNAVHHNTAYNNDAFAELGNSRSADNTFAFNKFTSTSTRSLFLVTRGSTDTYGPVLRTSLYNNSIYLPQSFKDAIVCYAGCDSTVIKLRNNISWGGAGAIYSDKAIDEDYNLFNGTVHINGGSTVGAHSKKGDPKFINPSAGDLHLQASSPAINAGVDLGYTNDLDNTSLPKGGSFDIGAYEL